MDVRQRQTTPRRAITLSLSVTALLASATPAAGQPAPSDPPLSVPAGARVGLMLATPGQEAAARRAAPMIERLGVAVVPHAALERALQQRRVSLRRFQERGNNVFADITMHTAEARCALRLPIVISAREDGQKTLHLIAYDPSFERLGGRSFPAEQSEADQQRWLEPWLAALLTRTEAAQRSESGCLNLALSHYNKHDIRRARRGEERDVDANLRATPRLEARVGLPMLGTSTARSADGTTSPRRGGLGLDVNARLRLLGGSWAHKHVLGLEVDGALAWPGEQALSARGAAGLTLMLNSWSEVRPELLLGWRQGWASASEALPAWHVRHPWARLSLHMGCSVDDRDICKNIVTLRPELGLGYFLRGPHADDGALWWSVGLEGRVRLPMRLGSGKMGLKVGAPASGLHVFARTHVEGVSQRSGARALSWWIVLPGLGWAW